MIIWDRIPDRISGGTALCIGKFDGFHRGHRLLIDEAKETGYPVVVLTFLFPHTETIDSVDEKRQIAEALGIDIYIEMEAGPAFFSLTPEAFIRDVVADRLHARHVIVGEDFRFGRDRAGDIGTLRSYEKEYHFELHAIRKLRDGDADISSSRIRECISKGQMDDVARMLGRPYRMSGSVTDGNRIGRQMGVPTANLIPESGKTLPPKGVYARQATVDGGTYPAIGNLGVKPTVGGDNPLGLEVHLLDYEDDLYGKRVVAEFGIFLREEKRFANVEQLHAQIEKDIQKMRKIGNNSGGKHGYDQ